MKRICKNVGLNSICYQDIFKSQFFTVMIDRCIWNAVSIRVKGERFIQDQAFEIVHREN